MPSKEHILAAAIECFATHGYQGTTIDRIARVAGVTKGALYYHFRDKEDLLFETVRNRIVGFEERVLAQTASDDSPFTTLGRVLDSCFVTATESNHRRFIMTLMVEALDTNPRLSEAFRLELRRMRAFLGDVIRSGQESGALRPNLVPNEVAAVIVATIVLPPGNTRCGEYGDLTIRSQIASAGRW